MGSRGQTAIPDAAGCESLRWAGEGRHSAPRALQEAELNVLSRGMDAALLEKHWGSAQHVGECVASDRGVRSRCCPQREEDCVDVRALH